MSKKSLESRLSIVEHQLVLAKGVLKEIYIKHGAKIAVRAKIVGGESFEGEPGEEFDAFQTRIRAIAEAERANVVVYGGLPDNPTEWATPPGMEEAAARVRLSLDEFEADLDEFDVDQVDDIPLPDENDL